MLLEREKQLAILEQALAKVAKGRGQTVLISGEAGIGKSSLTRAFLKANGANARIVKGACEDFSIAEPLAPLYDLAREVVAISEAGLKARAMPGAGGLIADETHFLNALHETIESGKTPADELLERYYGDWNGDLKRIYSEYSY